MMQKAKQLILKALTHLLRPVVNRIIADSSSHTCERLVQYAVQRPVDLVKLSTLFYYCYTYDTTYDAVPSECRRRSIQEVGLTSDVAPPDAMPTDMPSMLCALMSCFRHLWEHACEADFIDVGANIGTVALPMAAFIKNSGRSGQVFAFEPGLTAPLLEANIRVNGLEDFVRSFQQAVCDIDSVVPLHTLCAHSVGAHTALTPRGKEDELFITKLVSSCRLDTFWADKKQGRVLVIKIDAEGFDGECILGLGNILADAQVAAVFFEYSIGSMLDRCADLTRPLKFLHANNFSLFNLWNAKIGTTKKRIPTMERLLIEDKEWMTCFFNLVCTNNAWRQTDLCAINNNLPCIEDLLKVLREIFNS